MNRRTAMVASGALVIAMLIAGVAVTMGVTGPTARAGGAGRPATPPVRTTTEIVTIHRPAATTSAATATRTIVPATSTATSTGAPEFEETDDDGEHEGFEHEDPSDDDSGHEGASEQDQEHDDD
ncbi:MAG: hypothetical protein WD096_03855 [Actinomycetota bacterium]